MTSIKILRIACVLLASMAVFNCSDSGGGGGGKEEQDTILKTNDGHEVRVFQKGNLDNILTRIDTIAITDTSFSGTLIFKNMNPDNIPRVGDIINSAETKIARYGFLYKVLGVSTKNGVTSVVVRNASLEEAIKNVDFKGEVEYDFDKDGNMLAMRQKIYPNAKSVTLPPLSVNKEIEFKYGSIDVGVKYTTKFNFNINIEEHKLQSMKMSIEQKDVEFSLEGKLAGKIEGNALYPIFKGPSSPAVFLIGPLIVVINSEMQTSLKIAGSAETDLGVKFAIEGNNEYGFKYENGKVKAITESHFSPTFGYEMCVGGNVRIGIVTGFTFQLYGLIGPFFAAGPVLDLNVSAKPIGVFVYDEGFSEVDDVKLSLVYEVGINPDMKVFNKLLPGLISHSDNDLNILLKLKELYKTNALPKFTAPKVNEISTGTISVESAIKRDTLNYTVRAFGFCVEKSEGECKDGKGNKKTITSSINYGEKRNFNFRFEGLEDGITYRIRPYFENVLGGTYYDKATIYNSNSSSSSEIPSSSSSSKIPSSSSSSYEIPISSSSYEIPSSSSSNNCEIPSSPPSGAVKIGCQVWMSKNLDVNVPGSRCYGEDGSKTKWVDNTWVDNVTFSAAEIQANCAKYGRLYDWATAMALPASCNRSVCESQIKAKHRGICPSGWHIPSHDEWEELITAVGGYGTAGKFLKAKNGWYDRYGNPAGNGEDKYGFSALPGGGGYSDSAFYYVGYYGFWWSSSEDYSDYAYYRDMYYDYEYVFYYYTNKDYLQSVRCLQD